MGYDKEQKKREIDEILARVIGDNDWSDSEAGEWAKRAQNEIVEILKQDGYKIAVLTEAVAKGSGCVKVHYCLLSDDDLQINV